MEWRKMGYSSRQVGRDSGSGMGMREYMVVSRQSSVVNSAAADRGLSTVDLHYLSPCHTCPQPPEEIGHLAAARPDLASLFRIVDPPVAAARGALRRESPARGRSPERRLGIPPAELVAAPPVSSRARPHIPPLAHVHR